MNFLSKYKNVRKLLVAVVGTALMVAAPHVTGVTETTLFGVDANTVVSVILAILTAAGVYQASNDQASNDQTSNDPGSNTSAS